MLWDLAPTINPIVAQSGDIIWDLGDLDGTIHLTATITAVVQNLAGNQQDVRLTNQAFLSFEDDGQPYAISDSADVDLLEPTLIVAKEADPISAKPGQTVFYEITLYHAPTSTIPAYNVTLSDLIPDGLRYNPGSWQIFSEPTDTGIVTDTTAPLLNAFFPEVETTRTIANPIRLRYATTIDQNITQGALFTNTVTSTWTSLPDDPYGETRDGSGGIDDYTDDDEAKVSIDGISLSKTGAHYHHRGRIHHLQPERP